MKKIYLFATLFFLSVISYSQSKKKEVETAPSRIKVYTPTPSTNKESSGSESYKWVAKTDFLAIVTGEFPLIFEYRIARKFSVEGSAAITYAFFPNEYALSGDEDYTFEGKPAMGSAFRGAIKYYPSSDYDAIEGWSFGIQVFTKTTNRVFDEKNSGSPLLFGTKDSKNKIGASIIISKQIFQDSNICFESFIGVGIANVKRKSYSIGIDSNGNDSLITNEKQESVPNVQLGFRIGFGN